MAWIKAHQALVTHRKTLTLADELGTSVPAAIGHLVCLWTWALDNAADGSLAHVRPKTLAAAALWRKRPEDLLEALIVAGFVDQPQDGPLGFHDWDEYAGTLMSQRERNKRNQAEHRKRLRAGDVSDTYAGRVEKSREDKSREEKITPLAPLEGGESELVCLKVKELSATKSCLHLHTPPEKRCTSCVAWLDEVTA